MTRYRLSGAVMTHPKRRAAAERLARSAPPGALQVVMDPDPAGKPSVLRTALCAWEAIEDGATHHLVVQDDMILSDTFYARARAAISDISTTISDVDVSRATSSSSLDSISGG